MLSDNSILEILISLVLIYALLSILVSILLEWWNHKQKARAKFLKQAIFQLLQDPLNIDLGDLFYNHYLIDGLRDKQFKRSPQYISSQLFSEVLIDIIANRKLHNQPIVLKGQSVDNGKQYQLAANSPGDMTLEERFRNALDELNPSPFSDTLHSFVDKTGGNLIELKKLLAFWYDDYMDRVSGWYKSSQRTKMILFGFVVAIGLNIDSLHLIKLLSLDDTLRSNLVASSEKVAQNYQVHSEDSKRNVSELLKAFGAFDSITIEQNHVIRDRIHTNDSLNEVFILKADSVLAIASSLKIPLGWEKTAAPLSWLQFDYKNGKDISKEGGVLSYTLQRNAWSKTNLLYYLIGIFISGMSLSFGAPFWFETLVKLVNIRRAGKKPEAVNTQN